jgi:polygalacturonase
MKLLRECSSTDSSPSLFHPISTFIYGVSNNSASYPFNTDGFNIKSQHTLIENSVVYGGDDCVAINNKADDLLFRNAYCRGTHGLSVGSLGKDGANTTVQNIIIRDVKIEKSTYAARFKSWVGGGGWGRNITWENMWVVLSLTFTLDPSRLTLRPTASSRPLSVRAARSSSPSSSPRCVRRLLCLAARPI